MGGDRSEADKLDREGGAAQGSDDAQHRWNSGGGADPAAESGAGYGSHAPSPEEEGEEE